MALNADELEQILGGVGDGFAIDEHRDDIGGEVRRNLAGDGDDGARGIRRIEAEVAHGR